ncbi:MAG: hypothetical protein WC648_04930 [Candidatus Paceibacterota bacterium]|jgi:hypothetical protein
MNLIELITETKAHGKGSEAGRAKGIGAEKKDHTKSSKSKVKVYGSINKALKKGHMGQVFSTKNADRLYVITKHKWGKSGQQTVAGRTAKGFTPGSIPAKFKDVKRFAVRTMVRHGSSTDKESKGKSFWSQKRK